MESNQVSNKRIFTPLEANKNVQEDLHSKKQTWETLMIPNEMYESLFENGFHKPSVIQSVSIPKIMNNPDHSYLFQALNGSGKTLAFGIPALLNVDPSIPKVQVLIMGNTRELIRQTKDVLDKIGEKMKISVSAGEGDYGQILVTTLNFMKQKLVDRGSKKIDLSQCRLIIYDEADELFIQSGNQQACIRLKEHLASLKISPQIVMFSATFSNEVLNNIDKFVSSYESYTLPTQSLRLDNVKQFKYMIKGEKVRFLEELYNKLSVTMTMIFVNKIDTAIYIKDFLTKNNMKGEILYGKLDDKERDDIIERFRNINFNVLISTNVLARGIDIPQVDLVVNYDVPTIPEMGFLNPDYANYIHRVGRTGRFGTDGLSVTLLSSETDADIMTAIEKHYNTSIPEMKEFEDLFDVYRQMRAYLYANF